MSVLVATAVSDAREVGSVVVKDGMSSPSVCIEVVVVVVKSEDVDVSNSVVDSLAVVLEVVLCPGGTGGSGPSLSSLT